MEVLDADIDQHALFVSAADILGTGERVIVASSGVYRMDGRLICQRQDPLVDLAVVDHDGDGQPLTLGLSYRTTDDGTRHSDLTLFDGCTPVETIYTAPVVLHHVDDGQPLALLGGFAIADFLGNGERQIAVGAMLGHSGDGRFSFGYRLLSMTGDVLWSKPSLVTNMHSTATPLAVDFDGDGAHELLGTSGLILDGRTGETLYRLPNSEAIRDYHFIADLNQDGAMDLISRAHDGMGDFDLVVHSSPDWAPGPACWPSYAFDGTNINPDCSIPRDPTPPWLAGNTYRAVPSRPVPPRQGADLAVRFVEVCELECEELRARVAVQVGNLGLLAVEEPVRVSIFGHRDGQRELLQEHVLPEVPATTWLAPLDMYLFVEGGYDDLEATVVQEGAPVRQCAEDNDTARYGGSVCR